MLIVNVASQCGGPIKTTQSWQSSTRIIKQKITPLSGVKSHGLAALTLWSSLDGVEFRPMAITTMAFALEHIKKITKNLKVTVNDVMTGAILLGVRMYMEGEMSKSSSANSTALAMLNTRDTGGYASVSEMLKPKASMPWGNHFAFLHLPIPKLISTDSHDSLDFVFQTHQTVKRLKSNYAAFLTAQFLDVTRKVVGPQDDGEMYDEFGILKKKFRAKMQQAETGQVLPGTGRAGWEVEELACIGCRAGGFCTNCSCLYNNCRCHHCSQSL